MHGRIATWLRTMPELLGKVAMLGLACDGSRHSGSAAYRDMEEAAKAEAAGRAGSLSGA